MGNRKGRNCDLAVRVVTDLVTEAWQRKGIASMLLLDLKGAFDRVNHHALLRTLWDKGVPPALIRFVESFLSDRSSKFSFDNQFSQTYPIKSGVPQGSPLSPILFIIFIGTLYDELERVTGTSTIGFADDTNILAFGRTAEETVGRLGRAWAVCEEWARRRGMSFTPKKTKLIHFTRKRRPLLKPVQVGDFECKPVAAARFLGVWLDRKLKWSTHGDEILTKMSVQKYALTRLAAKTWGCSFEKAREIYTKCMRSAIAFGAPAWHTPTEPGKQPRGQVKRMLKVQHEALRVVSGAFRATPIRELETETACPPLDLVLNAKVCNFEQSFRGSPTHGLVLREKTKIDRILMIRGRRERVAHLALHCPSFRDAFRRDCPDIHNVEHLRRALADPKEALNLIGFMLNTGRLHMYSLFLDIHSWNLENLKLQPQNSKTPKKKKRKKKKPADNNEPGYVPPQYLNAMWVEKRVPGLNLTCQLPKYAFGKELAGWEVVSATYGPPHHLNSRARMVTRQGASRVDPVDVEGISPSGDCNNPIQVPGSTQPGDEEGNAIVIGDSTQSTDESSQLLDG